MAENQDHYSEDFISVPFFIAFLTSMIALLVFLRQGLPVGFFFLATIVLLIIWLNFSRLRVEVDYDNLSFCYGMGLIRTNYPLAVFTKAQVDKPPFSLGLLYHPLSVSGLILLSRHGKKVYVPTRRPKYLMNLVLIKMRD